MPAGREEARPLTAGEVARWEDDGYLLLEDQIPLEEIELTRRILRHDRDFLEAEIDQIDDEGRRARQSWRLWELPEGDVYAAFARHPAIVRRLEQLMGERVFHYHHKMILKEKGTAGSWLFHQVYVRSTFCPPPPRAHAAAPLQGYWHSQFARPLLASCMIALRPTSRANGALEVLRGSHKAGRLEHGQVGQRLDQVGAETRRVELLAEHCPLTPMEMEPGSLLFFHCNLLHSSGPNRSDQPGTRLICCYATVDNPPFERDQYPDRMDRMDGLSAEEGRLGPVGVLSAEERAEVAAGHWRRVRGNAPPEVAARL